jgi:hypothetical protein
MGSESRQRGAKERRKEMQYKPSKIPPYDAQRQGTDYYKRYLRVQHHVQNCRYCQNNLVRILMDSPTTTSAAIYCTIMAHSKHINVVGLA